MRRRARLLCWAVSLGLAAWGVAGAGSAGAARSFTPQAVPAPDYTYSSNVGAIGLQIQLAQTPEASSIPDLFDVQTPSSDAHLDSYGTSDASGHIGNLNGLGQLPSLICLAASGGCSKIPIGLLTGGLIPSLPPADPLDAHASYPANRSATAPTVGGKSGQVKVNSKGFKLGAGIADATAQALSTTTRSVDGNIGLAGAISIGNITTTTAQTATAGALTTTAEALISDVDIGSGKLLHIGSIRTSTTVISRPGKKPIDHTTSVVSNTKVLGLAARIDPTGVHIDKVPGIPATVLATVQGLLNKVLTNAGIVISNSRISRSDDDTGHNVSAAGPSIVFKHTVKGTPPVTIGLPAGIPCPIEVITSKLPIDPCAGVGISLNARYTGTVALGEVGVVSMASPGVSQGPLPGGNPPMGNGVSPPPVGTTNPTGSGGGFPTGQVTTPPGSTSGPQTTTTPPVIAAKPQSVADQLAGASRRLLWFFPLIMIGLLGIGGRLRFPARWPGKQ